MSLLLIRHRSVEYRKQLTQDLKYSGHLNDSASVNIWLHSEGDGDAGRKGWQVSARSGRLSHALTESPIRASSNSPEPQNSYVSYWLNAVNREN
ncbi:DUF3597 family protein [Paraburkholderia sp. CI2]|uniref:DUF3597 family protein n=1 Tax=unclassified Paraburkholderia TaxID=2615204 RepID=UPI0039080BD6